MKKRSIYIIVFIVFLFFVFGSFVGGLSLNNKKSKILSFKNILEPSIYFSADESAKTRIAGHNLALNDAINIIYYVKNESDDYSETGLLIYNEPKAEYSIDNYSYKLNDYVTTTISAVDYDTYYFTNVAAKQMTDYFYAVSYVKKDSTYIYSSVDRYSILDYCYNKKGSNKLLQNDSLITLGEMVESILDYGSSAQKIFNYHTNRLANLTYYKISIANGTLDDGFKTILCHSGETISLISNDYPGKEFYRWEDEGGNGIGNNEEINYTLPTLSSNKTLTAVWTNKITFVLNNGEDNIVIKRKSGESFEAPVPTKTGYTFNGWDQEVPATMPENDMTVSASWTINSYTLTLVLDNGEDNIVNNYDYMTNVVLPSSQSKAGYQFEGWYNGENRIDGNIISVTSNITLTAHWIQISSVGLEYAVNSDGITAKLIGVGTCSDENIIISSSYEGKSVTSIADSAFYNCTFITGIDIPNTITSIGNRAFYGCTNLQDVVIPSSVTDISAYAFYGTALVSISIPNSITTISNGLFASFASLQSVSIPNTVTSIGNSAFYDCRMLGSITIPNSVLTIGDGAFEKCSALQSIVLSNNLTSIGERSFKGCGYFTSITLPSTLRNIGAEAFQNCYMLESIIIPSGVTYIDEYTFSSCSALRNVSIPSTVTSIGTCAFQSCNSLKNITIPNSVTSIGGHSFNNCVNLTSIIIPISVTTMGANVFRNCSVLSIYCAAASKPSGWDSNWNYSNRPVTWGYNG